MSFMYSTLRNRRALVTGGANGIGREIVKAFARHEMRVIFNYRQRDKDAESLCNELRSEGAEVISMKCDLTDRRATEQLLEKAMEYFGGIDVLVNNAATLTRTSFLDITEVDYDHVLALNLRTPFFLTQRVANQMLDQGIQGSVINVSSLSARLCRSSVAHYQISKAGLEALTRSAAYELGQYGIRVNALVPGLTATASNRDQWFDNPTLWASRASDIPLGRPGASIDHAGAAVYFASDASSWVTGSCLVVDGGASIF